MLNVAVMMNVAGLGLGLGLLVLVRLLYAECGSNDECGRVRVRVAGAGKVVVC